MTSIYLVTLVAAVAVVCSTAETSFSYSALWAERAEKLIFKNSDLLAFNNEDIRRIDVPLPKLFAGKYFL